MKWGDPRLPERFWNKCIPEPNSGCWLWIGAQHVRGYGSLKFNGQARRAHQVAFNAAGLAQPLNTELDHKCRTTCCVNPEHLDPVTHDVNVLRGEGIAANYARRTHCKHGHEYTPENTYFPPWEKRPARMCRACRNVFERAKRKRTKNQ